MKKNSNLTQKLAAYSAMAAATVAAMGSANAQIVYTDCADVVFSEGTTYELDLNADGTNDYHLEYVFFTSTNNDQLVMAPLVTGNMQMGAAGWASWNWYGSALNLNDPINSAGAWVCPGGVDSRSRVFFATSFSSTVFGNFNTGSDQYMGLQFDIAGSLHYGWVRVNVVMDATAHTASMTLYDYAYNDVADAPILAGQTTVGIDEANGDAKVYTYDGQLNIQLEEAVNGTVTVYNTVGQVVLSQEITDASTVISMNSFDAGVYTVVIESADLLLQKKVTL